MDEEILGSVLHGIKPKDYTPIQVRPTPEFGGIQLTEEQQAKKDNMAKNVKDIIPKSSVSELSNTEQPELEIDFNYEKLTGKYHLIDVIAVIQKVNVEKKDDLSV